MGPKLKDAIEHELERMVLENPCSFSAMKSSLSLSVRLWQVPQRRSGVKWRITALISGGLAEREVARAEKKGTLEVTPWMQWFLGCLDRAFDGAELTLASVLRKARFWEVHAGESFNDRQRKIVNQLLNGFEGKLTSSKWAKLAKCSQDTAYRDILDLVSRGILARDVAGGRSSSYSLIEPAEKTAAERF